MGKEQELLEAARNGNLAVVERILSQRAKKTGPLASLRRGPGTNAHDPSGYTSLHHSALNGHREIVALLLDHEASANAVDGRGCTPLHLAAWTGNTEVVRLLLERGPSLADANHVNQERETALHFAAQYGHAQVVALLLAHGAEPGLRNVRGESPLDLAAQYGRLDSVALLAGAQAHSVQRLATAHHSPLHLAARNGHRQVVRLLLDRGFPVNCRTDTGTALHEAATFGKLDVVRLLLDYGVDVDLRDAQSRRATDVLEELNTGIAKQARDMIRERAEADSGGSADASPRSISPPPAFASPSARPSAMQGSSLGGGLPRRNSAGLGGSQDMLLDMHASRHAKRPSLGDVARASSLRPLEDHHHRSAGNGGLVLSLSPAELAQVPPPAFFTTARSFDEDSSSCGGGGGGGTVWTNTSSAGYLPMSALHHQQAANKPTPPAKPPRRSVAHSPGGGVYEQLCLASSGGPRRRRLSSGDSRSSAEYVDMRPNAAPGTQPPSHLDNHSDASSRLCELSSLYDQAASECLSGGGGRHARSASDNTGVPAVSCSSEGDRPSSLSLQQGNRSSSSSSGSKRATVQIPLSPSHYEQPPTPEFPPPSPATAESGIHSKIRPLSREYVVQQQRRRRLGSDGSSSRRSSRDVDTLTDEDELLLELNGDAAPTPTLVSSTATTTTTSGIVEEIVEENPFAGLCRGSSKTDEPQATAPVATEPGRPRPGPKPAPPPRKRGPPVDTSPPLHKDDETTEESPQKQPQPPSPFDENAEWAEIADIMASFGSGIARESVFARDMEEEFARTLTRQHKKKPEPNGTASSCPESIEQWLQELGLPEYANLLLVNGYDDVRFLGGGLVEDQDLLDMGVSNAEHRRLMVESAAQKLPPVPRLEPGSDPGLDSWLDSIGLGCYAQRFRDNGLGSVDRCRLIWELELNTVLEISKLGHQKRILASLGERASNSYADLDELDLGLSKLNMGLRELGVEDDDRLAPSSLRIRPPTQLMSDPGRSPTVQGTANTAAAQWRHDPQLLISSSCEYTAHYLGSTLVKELQGTESTRQSIHKLKTSMRQMGKVPCVLLSVSHRGVKFVDAVTKRPVCEHEIRNIHCACQDAEDLTHFAYITKEHKTNHHYCHVFCAQTMELATEIILTLGQAFEVAYQLALRDQSGNGTAGSQQNSCQRLPHTNSQRT